MLLPNRKKKVFHWQGIQANGQIKQGSLLAKQLNEVTYQLQQKGIIARKITQKRAQILPLFGANYHQQLAHISYQLAWTLESGLSLLQGLNALTIHATFPPDIMRALITIKTHVESGQSLTHACQQHPNLFNAFYCHQLAAGEQSGKLVVIFQKLAEYHQQKAEQIRQFKNILTYPCITLSLGIVIFILFISQIIPSFAELFRSFNAPIPVMTQYCLRLSKLIARWGWLAATLCLSLCCLCYYYRSRWLPVWDHWKLHLPYWGPFFQALATQRLMHALALTLSAGLSITQAIKTLSGITGNHYFKQKMPEIVQLLQEGQAFKTALEKTNLFEQSVIQWIQIGEESGMLDRTLHHIAKLNEASIQSKLQHIKQCLEPILMAFLGLSLGGLLLICYLPMFQLGNLL